MTNRAIVLPALAAAILVAACGGGGTKSQRPETPTASSRPASATQPSGATVNPPRTTTTAAALTQSQLATAVLAVTDLPTGWSTTPPSTNKKNLCNKDSVTKAVP